jgi:malate:quinone-oxidoreductase
MTTPIPSTSRPDVVLVGAGIMSATLAVILKELDPGVKIEIYEVLGNAAQESSNAWNNAGTGHAALCELNYTPQKSDGSIDISKALEVNTEFDLSRQLWSYLVKKGAIQDPQSFIHPVPHFSFVRGSENVTFLMARFGLERVGKNFGESAIIDVSAGKHSRRGNLLASIAAFHEGQGRILNSLFQSRARSAPRWGSMECADPGRKSNQNREVQAKFVLSAPAADRCLC